MSSPSCSVFVLSCRTADLLRPANVIVCYCSGALELCNSRLERPDPLPEQHILILIVTALGVDAEHFIFLLESEVKHSYRTFGWVPIGQKVSIKCF